MGYWAIVKESFRPQLWAAVSEPQKRESRVKTKKRRTVQSWIFTRLLSERPSSGHTQAVRPWPRDRCPRRSLPNQQSRAPKPGHRPEGSGAEESSRARDSLSLSGCPSCIEVHRIAVRQSGVRSLMLRRIPENVQPLTVHDRRLSVLFRLRQGKTGINGRYSSVIQVTRRAVACRLRGRI